MKTLAGRLTRHLPISFQEKMRKFDMNTNMNIIRPIRLSALICLAMLIATHVSAADNQFTESFDFEAGNTLSLDLPRRQGCGFL